MSDDADDELLGYCCGCYLDDVPGAYDGYCPKCLAERDAHPTWQAVQRVESGETTVRRRPDLFPAEWFQHYWLETSDGWRFMIFSDGEPWSAWDYIEQAVSPEGVVYEGNVDERDAARGVLQMPHAVWVSFSPTDAKWALLPRGFSDKTGALERVNAGGEP